MSLAASIVMLVWEELLHYLGRRLMLLTQAELEHLKTLSLDDVVKHLRSLAAEAKSRNGEGVPTPSLNLLKAAGVISGDILPETLPQSKGEHS